MAGISSAGVSIEWLAEGVEAADGSPTLAQPSVPLHKVSAFVPFAVEFETGAESPLAELQAAMSDAYTVEIGERVVNGSGSGQPNGMTTAIAATALGVAGTLAASDVYGLQAALTPLFQSGAASAANLSTINTIAQIETANGARMFPVISDGRLLRRPLVEDSSLASVGDASGASMAYGDFQRGYVLATGVGTRVELVPHILGSNGRPTGQRGYWLWARLGGDVVVVDNAIKTLGV